MRNSQKKNIWRFVFWAALVGAAACFAVAVRYHWSRYSSEKNYQKVREEVTGADASGAESAAAVRTGVYIDGLARAESPDSWAEDMLNPTLSDVENLEFTGMIDAPEPKIPEEVLLDAEESPIDFEKLQAINPELYAWIRVPGTAIDYPVAQRLGVEQEYYLHHDLYGNPQFAGCIFSQSPAAFDFTDPVTVLYGHNMRNGSMFRGLYEFLEPGAITDEDRYVYIYTPYETLIYEIYSAYRGDSRNITGENDFSDKKVFEDYIESTLKPRDMDAVVKSSVDVTKDDRILTLSTCVYQQPSLRVLVQAVLRGSEAGE